MSTTELGRVGLGLAAVAVVLAVVAAVVLARRRRRAAPAGEQTIADLVRTLTESGRFVPVPQPPTDSEPAPDEDRSPWAPAPDDGPGAADGDGRAGGSTSDSPGSGTAGSDTAGSDTAGPGRSTGAPRDGSHRDDPPWNRAVRLTPSPVPRQPPAPPPEPRAGADGPDAEPPAAADAESPRDAESVAADPAGPRLREDGPLLLTVVRPVWVAPWEAEQRAPAVDWRDWADLVPRTTAPGPTVAPEPEDEREPEDGEVEPPGPVDDPPAPVEDAPARNGHPVPLDDDTASPAEEVPAEDVPEQEPEEQEPEEDEEEHHPSLPAVRSEPGSPVGAAVPEDPVVILECPDRPLPAVDPGETTATVRFQVVHREADPVPGAGATLLDARGRATAQGVVDVDGWGELRAPPGSYLVVCTAAGHRPRAVELTMTGTGTDLEVRARLARSSSLVGTVRAGGRPLTAAHATLTQHGQAVDAAETGPDGIYRITDLGAGAYLLRVTAPGCDPAIDLLAVPEEGQLRHDVDLEPGPGPA